VLVVVHVAAAIFLARVIAMLHPLAFKGLGSLKSRIWGMLEPLRVGSHKGDVRKRGDTSKLGPVALHGRRGWTPVALNWGNIACTYKTNNGLKTVLKGVSGAVLPGELCALMGPSGAGKSTLMDILAARKTVGDISGTVTVNHSSRKSKAFIKMAAYVPQDAHFLPTLTVAETCRFYAKLMLPRGSSSEDYQAAIDHVLAAMGLAHTTQTLVGGVLPGGILLRGLSGGERKRLSIATALLADPAIVFLDEPTSGLDSFAALSVMQHMKDLAQGGSTTVVASIHQPGPALWALFDKVAVLSQGHAMYSGPREGLVGWFTGLGYGYDPIVQGSPSDWVMDLVNIGFGEQQLVAGSMGNMEELQQASKKFMEHYAQLQTATMMESQATASVRPGSGDDHSLSATDDLEAVVIESALSRSATSVSSASEGGRAAKVANARWFTQTRVLFWRELLSVSRNPADAAGRILVFSYTGLLCGLFFYNLSTGFEGLRSRLNLFYIEAFFLVLLPHVYMSLYTADKQYFLADTSAKLYRPSAYYIAKQLAALPFNIGVSLAFVLLVYGMSGLRWQAGAVLVHTAVNVLLYLVAAQVIGFSAVVAPSQDAAFMMSVAWTAVNALASNYVVRMVDLSLPGLQFFRWLTAMGYAYSTMMQKEFEGVTFPCATSQGSSTTTLMQQLLPKTSILRTSAFTNIVDRPSASCILDPSALMDYFGVDNTPIWVNFTALAGYLLVLHVMTYLGLLLLARKERR